MYRRMLWEAESGNRSFASFIGPMTYGSRERDATRRGLSLVSSRIVLVSCLS